MEILRALIPALIGAALTHVLLKVVARDAARPTTGRELRYGGGMRVMAVAVMGIATLIGYVALHARPDQRLMAFGLASIFLVSAIWLALEVLFTRIRFDDIFIYAESPWRKPRRIPYAAITGYAFSAINQRHTFLTDGLGKLHLSAYLQGIDQFGAFVERKLSALKPPV